MMIFIIFIFLLLLSNGINCWNQSNETVIEESAEPSKTLFYVMLIITCILFLGSIVSAVFACRNKRWRQYKENKHVSHIQMMLFENSPYPALEVQTFMDYVKNGKSSANEGLKNEFKSLQLENNGRWSINIAQRNENVLKNRYGNIIAYDHSRVALQDVSNGNSDYINASFIDGFNRRNAYIATQGPLLDTIAEFWQMVYEQNSEIIVMVSNFMEGNVRKSEIYWDSNGEICYDNKISVRKIYRKKMAFYTERRFVIKNSKNTIINIPSERIIYHYQYNAWLNRYVPSSCLSFLKFIKETVKHWSESSGPVIVHSSSGVGRTGIYMCIESEIRQIEAEGKVNVKGFIEHIGQQRPEIIQNDTQYIFIHNSLYEYYFYTKHEIIKDDILSYISTMNNKNGLPKFEEQFQACIQYTHLSSKFVESRKEYNLWKNRSDICPIKSRRIKISCESGIEGSEYINASVIQGYWKMKEYIITQHPLEKTENEFWKMVYDENCSLIVLLSDDNLERFWPDNEHSLRTSCWTEIKYCSSDEIGARSNFFFILNSTKSCSMKKLKKWSYEISEMDEFIQLLFDVMCYKDDGPILVIDNFGGSRAGIFVSLCNALHQLRNDGVVDIYFIIKTIHMERPNTFSSSSDLKFVYDILGSIVANHYSNSFFTNAFPNYFGENDNQEI